MNEIFVYLEKSCESFERNILDVWRTLTSRFFALTQMIKDVLFIFVFEVEVKRLFFMTRDVVTYRKNRFLEIIIENIMILKKLYTQKKAKAKKNNNEASIVIINVDDEISEELINESTQWIADDDDDFLLVDDVNEKSSLNETNESHS